MEDADGFIIVSDSGSFVNASEDVLSEIEQPLVQHALPEQAASPAGNGGWKVLWSVKHVLSDTAATAAAAAASHATCSSSGTPQPTEGAGPLDRWDLLAEAGELERHSASATSPARESGDAEAGGGDDVAPAALCAATGIGRVVEDDVQSTQPQVEPEGPGRAVAVAYTAIVAGLSIATLACG